MPFAALRLSFAALCLLALGACAHRTPASPAAWAGEYAFGTSRLQLHASGEFDYRGGSCFPGDSDSDVGLPDEFAGRYRLEGRWLLLESLTGAPAGCSGLGLKLYTVRADGQRFLFDEGYLRALVNEVRNGRTHERFSTWHPTGDAEALTMPLLEWLPAPYADWLRQQPPAGQVIAIGPVSTRTRYGAAGRIDGEENAAALSVDFGQRHGAFEGMRVCVEGRPDKLALDHVGEAQSTLRWRWSTPERSPPGVGTRVSGACPVVP